MKALIEYPYDGTEKRVEEINTIEDLLILSKKEGHDLIVSTQIDRRYPDTAFTVLVYDGYIE